MSEFSDDSPEKPSKTQIKNEMLALQKLGETLIKLSESELTTIPVPETLLRAIHQARLLKSHEAIRRQLQHIGKLMRHIDPEPIKKALAILQSTHVHMVSKFHEVETWRDQLIATGDDGLQKFMEIYPLVDRQNLRQLIRNAQRDKKNAKNTGADTELFKFLRNIIQV